MAIYCGTRRLRGLRSGKFVDVIEKPALTNDSVCAIILNMADTAADILNKWREYVPPEVSKEDVEKVVNAYFPKTHRFNSKAGSHWLFVEDPYLRKLEAQG